MLELRDFLFNDLKNRKWNFTITSRESGILSGVSRLKQAAGELGIEVIRIAEEGHALKNGSCILQAVGDAEKVIRAEEMLVGIIGKPSGVATASANLIRKADGRIKVICGAWKKVAPEVRSDLRQAIATGGAGIRITDQPFIYLDKNYVRILGGVGAAVARAKEYDANRTISVQIRGETGPIEEEAVQAYDAGAGIVMVDTGRIEDLKKVSQIADSRGWRSKLQIAYAGGFCERDLQAVVDAGGDIVDVGRAIIDAPLLDLSLDING